MKVEKERKDIEKNLNLQIIRKHKHFNTCSLYILYKGLPDLT